MNNSSSSQQISKTGNLKQSEVANQLRYSCSTLQRYRNDINMLSPYRIPPNNTNKATKKFQILTLTTINIANMTSKDLI